ncbi:MAG TPA: NADPH-dependent FMN reductase [Bacillus sp. (in: firmicutes)]|nr:NADPH-dependent FMN reductase [Bacillus sp. (in: firmicutes)]
MANIVIISGSPSPSSRSSAVADFVGELLEKEGNQLRHIKVRDLPAEDLLYAKFDSPAVQQAKTLVAGADAVVVVSPVYKASYTGIFKTFFDLLPEKALSGKTILPIANGGTTAHLLSLEYAFKPLVSVLGATDIVDGVFIADSQVQYSETELTFLSDEAEQRLRANVQELVSRLTKQPKASI